MMKSTSISRLLDKYQELLDNKGDSIITYNQPLIWEKSAYEYLEWAKIDITCDSERNRVNSFCNAKRSLHNRLDTLLIYYWLIQKSDIIPFNQKISKIENIKINLPEFLNRLNRYENNIEHDYIFPPSKEDIISYISIVDLFLDYTDFLLWTPAEIVNVKIGVNILFDIDNQIIYIDDNEGKKYINKYNGAEWYYFAEIIMKKEVKEELNRISQIRKMGYCDPMDEKFTKRLENMKRCLASKEKLL